MKTLFRKQTSAWLRILAVITAMTGSLLASAYDFKVGDLCYNKYNETTVYVTYELEGNWEPRYTNLPANLTIPATVTYQGVTYTVASIGEYAFRYCEGLTKVVISNGIQSIREGAFMDCTGLTSINIPSSVTSIGESALCRCSSLTSVTIPNSVATMGSHVFYECTGLKNVTLPNQLKTITAYMFYGCTSLESFNMPNSVTHIHGSAFSGCSSLKNVTWSENLVAVYMHAFEGSAIESLVLPATFTNFETSTLNGAFQGCAKTLKSIVVAECNPVFDSRGGCNALINTATNTVLLGCCNTVIPSTVTTIGNDAFYDCVPMTSISFPSSVKRIEQNAFRGCTGLKNVDFNQVTSLANYAFENCGLETLTIPASLTSISSSSFWGCPASLNEITVDPGNSYYSSPNGCNAIIGGTTLVLGCRNTVIPNTVKSVEDCAFLGCSALTNLELPEALLSIGSRAFQGCSGLTSLELPETLTSIGSYAFYSCSGLESITIPPLIINIGNYTFYNCRALTNISLPSVKTIGEQAFYSCSGLNRVTMGSELTSIGVMAFYYCQSLESVYCLAPTPPTIGASCFGRNANDRKIYVLADAVEAYKTKWKAYANAIFSLATGGDVDGDGTVTSGDVTTLYNFILNSEVTYNPLFDVNGDGTITATDVTIIYNIILGF